MLQMKQQPNNFLSIQSRFTKSTLNQTPSGNNNNSHSNRQIRELSVIQQTLQGQINYNQSLQVGIYSRVNKNSHLNQQNRNSDKQSLQENVQWSYEDSLVTPKIRLRSKKQLFLAINEEQNRQSVFYMMIKLLFPEIYGLPPLSIDIIDTIFYTSDGSMVYIYTDPKRGLVKTKSKNYPEIFFRRKAELDHISGIGHQQITEKKKNLSQLYEETFLKGYNYCALIRYKDQNFIRLKEDEFKSIFTRPVQANQRYKLANNAYYIQMIPDHINYTENTIIPIQFILQQEQKKPIFHKAIQLHCQETSFKFASNKTAYPQDQQEHLLYIIYEIFGYIHIHYRKKIKSGIFQFMKIHHKYYLSNIRKIVLDQSKQIANQYAKSNIFNNCHNSNEIGLEKMWLANLIGSKQENKSQLNKQMETLFEKENKKICNKVQSFVKNKFDEIKNKKDMEQSQRVFNSLNSQCKKDLHYFFENNIQYRKFINEKEQKFDRTSPLMSISNISWKKSQFFNTKLDKGDTISSKNQFFKEKKINSMFQSQKIPRIPTTHKWRANKKI